MPVLVNPYRFGSGGLAASNLQAAVGGFNAPNSGTTGTTCSVTGLAFQPKIVLLWMTGRTETSDAAALGTATGFCSVGMFTASEQYTWGTAYVHNSANSNVGEIHRTDCCLMKSGVANGGTTYRGLTFSAMNSDGFTLAIDSHDTRAWLAERIQYLALGGSDLASVKVGTISVTNGTGNQSYTPLAFQPAALLFANIPPAINTLTGFSQPMLGAATGPSNMWVWGGESDQNAATMDTARYFRSDECHAFLDSAGAALDQRYRLVSLDATGFTLNRLENGITTTAYYGALSAGINAKAGTFTAASGGGSVTGLGFTPKAILFMTHGTTESTADTPQQDHTFAIGASVTGITQRCAHVHDVDNQANSVVALGHRDDSVLMTTNSSAALDSRIAVASHDSDGFTYTMPTSTNNGYIVGYLALG